MLNLAEELSNVSKACKIMGVSRDTFYRYRELADEGGVDALINRSRIGPGLYQYTSVDDCTRYRVLRLYSRRTAANTLDFIDCVIEEMPFPIQCLQTDRGREFFAVKVQEKLKEYSIKFRPNKPASPHLNGKVERSQKTDKAEFYATVDLSTDDLKELLAEWQHYYNWERPHSAHNGKTPMERYFELAEQTPYSDAVHASYQPNEEHIQEQNYKLELELRKLKRCLCITQLSKWQPQELI
ncbi:transposase [Escherichia coli]|nr:integrase core domain-containing protein [Escherichia coli]MBF8877636.1 transposase [Escherichia coli]